MDQIIILSHYQADPLLAARQAGQARVFTSLDLNLTRIEVSITPEGALLPSEVCLSWPEIEAVSQARNSCFYWQAGCFEKVQQFSPSTNRFCSLMPTAGAPTLLIAGFPMHRIKDIDPYQDTLTKIRAVRPLRGSVLDTTTGLGYTAIEASREAQEVITIEIDPVVLEIARFNPWSRGLFANANIRQIVGDSFEMVRQFTDGQFSRIIHDPPTRSLAGELYSAEMYHELYRLLARRGRLSHYIGDLNSSSGRGVVKGVIQRLLQAGFSDVRPAYQAFGVVASK